MARSGDPRLRRRTAKDAKHIVSVGLPYAVGLGRLVQAGLDRLADNPEAAQLHLVSVQPERHDTDGWTGRNRVTSSRPIRR